MTPPSTIAHYRIVSKLGEGGMGAVYRAIDTKLNRNVAIKVLPDSFAADPDRLARFTRESQVLASLNHPNIAAIYGVEERALVMELVEGENLRGPVPPATALAYARQIADALDAAHEKGIVHRDLKPANIRVTPEGVVKILDFGVAKIAEPAAASASAADSPTLTIRATQAGIIMGTAAYMAPEQARGHAVDKRADIWAFGTVLFEMLTGTPLFEGDSISDTLAAVLKSEIDWKRLPPETPAPLRRLMERCLERDRKKRLRDIGDAALESTEPALQPRPSGKPLARWIAAVLALALGGALWALWRAPARTAERALVQLDLDAGPNGVGDPAISPDGSRIVFVSSNAKESHLATRRLDQNKIAALATTGRVRFPFFSPDGGTVAYSANGKLMKLPLDGGAPSVLANASLSLGGDWSESGEIAASLNAYGSGVIDGIPAVGGIPQPLTAHTGDFHASPHFLPGGKGLLFSDSRDRQFNVRLALPGQKQSTVLIPDAIGVRYLPSGHLVFHRQGKVYAVAFDLDRLKLTGDAVPLVDDVGFQQFDVSPAGVLVYVRGAPTARLMTKIDGAGKQEQLFGTADAYYNPKLSPDGSRLAFVLGEAPHGRIMVHDQKRATTIPVAIDDRDKTNPEWTPDGLEIVFTSGNDSFIVRADGGGQLRPFTAGGSISRVTFSRDGRIASFRRTADETTTVWIAPVVRQGGSIALGDAIPLPQTSNPRNPVLSRDGRWVAYMSNESGTYEIYVASLGADGRPSGGRWMVSSGGGYDPVWSAAGQIFYKNAAGHIEVVSYSVKGDSFQVDDRRESSAGVRLNSATPQFDVTADGKQIIAVVDSDIQSPETHLRVILNFGDEVRRLVKAR